MIQPGEFLAHLKQCVSVASHRILSPSGTSATQTTSQHLGYTSAQINLPYSVVTQVVVDDWTVQSEYINQELWLYIVNNVLVQ